MPDLEHPWGMPCDDPAVAYLCGLIRPVGWQRIGRTLPTLAQAGPDLAIDPSKTVLLYKCYKDMFSDYPDYPAQQIGDCISFGWGHGHDLLEVVESWLGDLDYSAIRRTCTEFIYGEARKVSGDLGPFDGSYGGAAAKAMTTIGVVSYGELAEVNEPTVYAGSRAKSWGRTGPPTSLEPIAATHKLGGAAMLTSADDMIAALQNGHPCTICTAHGFTMTRDASGACQLKGRWGHCMHVTAYRASGSGFPAGFLIHQSWGPDQPTGPQVLDQPSWSFWCSIPDMGRIIDEGDSYALAGSPGFAPKSLPASLGRAA